MNVWRPGIEKRIILCGTYFGYGRWRKATAEDHRAYESEVRRRRYGKTGSAMRRNGRRGEYRINIQSSNERQSKASSRHAWLLHISRRDILDDARELGLARGSTIQPAFINLLILDRRRVARFQISSYQQGISRIVDRLFHQFGRAATWAGLLALRRLAGGPVLRLLKRWLVGIVVRAAWSPDDRSGREFHRGISRGVGGRRMTLGEG